MTSRLIVNSIRHTGASADAITLDNSGNATFPANVTCSGTASGFGGGRAHNLIINGAMQVAQRGTSSTSSGYATVDRFRIDYSGTDEAPTQAQVDVASGTTPYTLGFRKAFKITNGNQTSGAGSSDFIYVRQTIEAQDIANSGWNYTSASSYITLSFWIKSSVAQNFYGYLQSMDGTNYAYVYETGSLTANTWTKVTKTISGNSNLTFNNDNGHGLDMMVVRAFDGTDRTASMSLNAWATYSGTSRTPDQTSTWYTTNDATLEITGVLLEVGETASDFPHESYGDTLAKCQRYFLRLGYGKSDTYVASGLSVGGTYSFAMLNLPTTMRAAPTLTEVDSLYSDDYIGSAAQITGIISSQVTVNGGRSQFAHATHGATGRPIFIGTTNATSGLDCSAEL